MSFNDYRDTIYDEYRKLKGKEGTDEYKLLRQTVTDFCAAQNIEYDGFALSTKSVVAQMQSAKQQFISLVCHDLVSLYVVSH